MINTQLRADDALKYAAAILRERVEWTTDSIVGSDCDHHDGHELECDAIREVVIDICALAAQFGDPCRYSDGRRVTSVKEIEYGFSTHHVWHPNAHTEQPRSWTGPLLSHDPDVDSPGVFEVTTTPLTQEIFVRVVRTA
jgi:hypothetical protein